MSLPRRRPSRTALTSAGLALAAAPLLGGCASTVGVAVAPDAANPACARVVLALPESLGDGLDERRTTSQATWAWGEGADPVTLRCGVEVPGPTTEQCVTMETAAGTSIDWLVRADAEPADAEDADPGALAAATADPSAPATATEPADPLAEPGSSDWTFVTYGRDPAVEVHVPAAVVAERSTSFLDALSPAIAQVEATRSCL
ncbi:DUF3515 family protein [Cellulomonas pakistanensis]|uniref:DUF3515 domain-containing protein n=1 Tax=Cellulomonas pakistanensis TaxID=992287 RepID=A0A919PC09_9CELL|nr:DUF3515 family protein [Cellulomonas pakistanensis]GIG37408.1 hypothetical protein Cpa01nite_27890 [Cellulomonas pakistanensis]